MLKNAVFLALVLGVGTSAGSGAAQLEGTVLIVKGSKQSWRNTFAAEEFLKYVQAASNRKFQILSDKSALVKQGKEIVLIGNDKINAVTASLVQSEDIDFSAVSNHSDGFLIRSVAKNGQSYLVLAGTTDMATVYAVYHYLENLCGIGFFFDGDYVPADIDLPIAGIDICEVPRFKYRSLSAWVAHHGLVQLCPHMWDRRQWKRFLQWCAKKKCNGIVGIDIMAYAYHEAGGDLAQQAFPEDYSYPPAGPADNFDPNSISDFDTAWIRNLVAQRKLTQFVSSYGRRLGIAFPYTISYAQVTPEYARKHPELKYMTPGRGIEQFQQELYYYIDPREPEGREYAKKEWAKIIELFGTDHVYRYEPYSAHLTEGGMDPHDAKIMATQNFFKVIKEIDPHAKWVTTTWDMRHGGWPADKVKKLLNSIPDDVYWPIITNTWMEAKKFDYFGGREWGLSHLVFLAMDHYLHGNLEWSLDQVKTIDALPNSMGEKCVAYNMGSEFVYDPMFHNWEAELAWKGARLQRDEFLKDYALRRFGKRSLANMHQSVIDLHEAMKQTHTMGEFEEQLWFVPQPQDECVKRFQQPFIRHFDRAPWPGQKPQWAVDPKTDWSYWHKTFDKTIPLFHKAVEYALRERDRQRQNELYKNYLIELTRNYVENVAMRHWLDASAAYEAAVGEFKQGKSGQAQVAAFDKKCGIILELFDQLIKLTSTDRKYSLQHAIDHLVDRPGSNPYGAVSLRRWATAYHGYQSHGAYELYVKVYKPRFELYYDALKAPLANKETTYLIINGGDSPEDQKLSGQFEDIVRRWVFEPIDIRWRYEKPTIDTAAEVFEHTKRIEE